MTDWEKKIVAILESDALDLRELAELAGGSPKTFYRGCNLSGVDLRGQDLRGMEFTGLTSSTIVDARTKLDPRYQTFINSALAQIEPPKKGWWQRAFSNDK